MLLDEIRIPTKCGNVIRIDSSDAWALSTRWHVIRSKKDKYISVKDRTGRRLGRVVMGAARGQVVDHVNGDTLDNRKANLRFCTVTQNGQNKKGHGKHPYKGIIKFPNSNRWYAQIVINRKRSNLGGYATIEEAAKAYDVAAKAAFGEFARLNFPEGDDAH